MCDLLDRLALDEVLASYPRNRLHDKHPQPPASFESRQPNRPTYRGSILDADPPAQGVNIAGRMTLCPRAISSGLCLSLNTFAANARKFSWTLTVRSTMSSSPTAGSSR